MPPVLGPFSIDRVCSAIEKVRQRLFRAAAALDGAKVAYAVVGGNAVALWVSRVDESAVRATQDVDILIERGSFEAAKVALEGAGFVYRRAAAIDLFLDGPGAKARDAVHIIFAGEMVRPHEPAANPEVTDSERADGYTVLSLLALVRIELTAFGDKNRTYLRDLIEVGLVGRETLATLPPVLAERLQQLLDTPDG